MARETAPNTAVVPVGQKAPWFAAKTRTGMHGKVWKTVALAAFLVIAATGLIPRATQVKQQTAGEKVYIHETRGNFSRVSPR